MKIGKTDLMVLLFCIDNIFGDGDGKLTLHKAANILNKKKFEFLEFGAENGEYEKEDNNTLKPCH